MLNRGSTASNHSTVASSPRREPYAQGLEVSLTPCFSERENGEPFKMRFIPCFLNCSYRWAGFAEPTPTRPHHFVAFVARRQTSRCNWFGASQINTPCEVYNRARRILTRRWQLHPVCDFASFVGKSGRHGISCSGFCRIKGPCDILRNGYEGLERLAEVPPPRISARWPKHPKHPKTPRKVSSASSVDK